MTDQARKGSRLDLDGNVFEDCGTAVDLRGQWDIRARGNKLIRTKRGFVVADDIPKEGQPASRINRKMSGVLILTVGAGLAVEAVSGIFSRLVGSAGF